MSVFAPRGLLFDCDGVLVDSDASVLTAWSRWAVEHGLDPEHVTSLVHGRRSADTVAALLPAERVPGALAAIDRYEVEDAAAVTALPGAGALLASLPVGAWAVVTSGVTALARARLAAAALPEPAVLVTADDVAEGKPAPDGYLAAAARLGLPPHACVVFEDAPSGVRAARAAGVGAVVGIGSRSARLDVDRSVDDLSRVRWADGSLHVD